VKSTDCVLCWSYRCSVGGDREGLVWDGASPSISPLQGQPTPPSTLLLVHTVPWPVLIASCPPPPPSRVLLVVFLSLLVRTTQSAWCSECSGLCGQHLATHH